MPSNATSTLRHHHLNRRRFLKITGIATATAVLGADPAMHCVYAAALTQAQREKLTADDIIALMKTGNQRFRLGQESRTITSPSSRQPPRVSIPRR